ncbi:MAG: twin arginine-targeting protein translocase TatC [Gammaproteobacteria bacterium 39-13]|nr:MAG: twin arginine-targeting protein translocase TatC [Gammaproteobacteria bacterium 39-13]
MDAIDKYLPHLIELRQRILRCLLAYIIVLVPLIIFSSELYSAIAQPILKTLPMGGMLIATEVVTPFTAPIKLALFTTTIILIPYMLYHLWAFVRPGLYASEKKTIFPVLLISTTLFYLGMAFAHFIVCPLALSFFMQIAPKGVTVMTDMTHYLDFVLVLYFAFGVSFQVPIITFLLIRVGITSVDTLKKHRPYIIVGAFVIGMILTPPDVISQCLLAIPLLALFESGLLLAKWLQPSKVILIKD